MDELERELYDVLRRMLELQGITATPDHSSSGEDILLLPKEIGLMVLVEVSSYENGAHTTAKLGEPLADAIKEIRGD